MEARKRRNGENITQLPLEPLHSRRSTVKQAPHSPHRSPSQHLPHQHEPNYRPFKNPTQREKAGVHEYHHSNSSRLPVSNTGAYTKRKKIPKRIQSTSYTFRMALCKLVNMVAFATALLLGLTMSTVEACRCVPAGLYEGFEAADVVLHATAVNRWGPHIGTRLRHRVFLHPSLVR